jgi:hypothetical protein
MRRNLNQLLSAYDLEDIFNADETGLYYRMNANTTLATGPVSGEKKDKTRITIMFTTNASGTMALKPLVINNSKMPVAFRNAGITHNQLPVDYANNKKAWMRHDIFQVVFLYYLPAQYFCFIFYVLLTLLFIIEISG